MSKQDKFCEAIIFDNISLVRSILKHKDFDPSFSNNRAIILACDNERLNIIKLLLADSRVDPSASFNSAIYCTKQRIQQLNFHLKKNSCNKIHIQKNIINIQILSLLWNHEKVKKTLKVIELKYIKN
jgi:hypothetical protein